MPAICFFLNRVVPHQMFQGTTAQNSENSGSIMPANTKKALVALKCTVVIRVLDFVEILLKDSRGVQLLEKNFVLSSDLFELLVACVFEPSFVGFNLPDNNVTRDLVPRMTEFLSCLRKSLPPAKRRLLVTALEQKLGNEQLSALLPENIKMYSFISPDHHHYLQVNFIFSFIEHFCPLNPS